jgi:hypothetical protein
MATGSPRCSGVLNGSPPGKGHSDAKYRRRRKRKHNVKDEMLQKC